MAALALFGYWGAMTWLPTYLTTERGLPSTSVALFITMLNLGMFVGYNGFGYLADHIGRHRTIIITLLGVTLTLPIYALTTQETALLWMGPLFGAFTAFFGLFGSYLGELFPTRARATGAGFCFDVGRGVSALAPFALARTGGESTISKKGRRAYWQCAPGGYHGDGGKCGWSGRSVLFRLRRGRLVRHR